jgi:hypothetical protein
MDSEQNVATGTTPARRTFYTRLTISLCAFALLLLHRLLPKLLPTDTVGMALLLIIVLPWILGAMPLSEIELLGVKLKLREVADEQKQQGQTLAAHEQTINDLVTYSMSASIFRHLCGIGLLKEYNYEDSEANRREFYFLRDNGFIRPKSAAFLEFNGGTPHNVCEIAAPTPIGWLSIKLRRGEIPREWLTPERKSNLAVDPSTL